MGVSQAPRFVSSGFRMTEAVDEILADVDRGSLHASQGDRAAADRSDHAAQ
jgi:hypothetical protein